MATKTQRFKRYSITALIIIAVIIGSGWIINSFVSNSQYIDDVFITQKQAVDQHFEKALVFMNNNQYQQAVDEWNQLLMINASIPEAYANRGFSLYELKRYQAASESFNQATNINPYQVNAYYGLAICFEKLGDIPAATGAMRSYIHLANKDDPFIRKARSALWEWESQLGKPEASDN